jgi:hypothetical protein
VKAERYLQLEAFFQIITSFGRPECMAMITITWSLKKVDIVQSTQRGCIGVYFLCDSMATPSCTVNTVKVYEYGCYCVRGF